MFEGPWQTEDIPDIDDVYRQVHFGDLVKKPKNRRFPNEAHFSPDPDGLSVNWSKYCDVNRVFIVIGLTHKADRKNYKSPADYKLFKFNVGLLRSIDGINDVLHDPQFFGNPPSVGNPNNRAHSLIKYADDEELRLKLSDHVRDNYDDMFCDRDLGLIEPDVAALKKRIEEAAQSER
jgi:hypothetical protein